jgi:hypothetical protein
MDERVRNGGIAGALAFLVMVAIGIFAPEAAAEIPTGTEAAITVVITTLTAYMIPRNKEAT